MVPESVTCAHEEASWTRRVVAHHLCISHLREPPSSGLQMNAFAGSFSARMRRPSGLRSEPEANGSRIFLGTISTRHTVQENQAHFLSLYENANEPSVNVNVKITLRPSTTTLKERCVDFRHLPHAALHVPLAEMRALIGRPPRSTSTVCLDVDRAAPSQLLTTVPG